MWAKLRSRATSAFLRCSIADLNAATRSLRHPTFGVRQKSAELMGSHHETPLNARRPREQRDGIQEGDALNADQSPKRPQIGIGDGVDCYAQFARVSASERL